MPLTLPVATVLAPPSSGLRPDLSVVRETRYRFEVLDTAENLVGELSGVEPSGSSVDWTATASVKGGGTLRVTDRGEHVDWLRARIRPVVIITDLLNAVTAEYPVGIFLPSAPVEQWTATGKSWDVELLDKCSILDSDVPTDASGNPTTFTAQAGTNVIATVSALIAATGESTQAIAPDDKIIPVALTWDMGTTILKIVNDILDASNYFSLWVDSHGQFQVTPYQSPRNRAPAYGLQGMFSKSELSMMAPEWSRDRDIYSVPNRFVAIGQGDQQEAAMVATAINNDPTSPFSYGNRGRWITEVVTGIEAASYEDLLVIAQRRLAAAVRVTSSITVQHILLPDLRVNRTVMFTNPEAGIDAVCVVTKTQIPFDPTALCSSTLEQVT